MYYIIASAILVEEVQDVQNISFRTLAIEIVTRLCPHVLEMLHIESGVFMVTERFFSFLLPWRVGRDASGNAILVRDGPPAPACNALSPNEVEFLKEQRGTRLGW